MAKGRITEIFDSLQGEGLYLGEKQIFVRFFGCNLSCRFCDTKLSCYKEYEPEELLKELLLYQDDYHSVSFTGGEPLLQKNFLKEALKLTALFRYKNYLETNGTLPGELEEVIEYVDIIAMDFKLPTSAQMGNLWGLHRKFLKIASRKEVFLKAVVCDSTEDEDLKQAVDLIREINRSAILVLQPNSFEKNHNLAKRLGNFKDICRKDGITTCVIPQMHKAIGIK